MVKDIDVLKVICDVALLTDPIPEDARWMGVLVTRDTPRDLDRPELSLSQMAFVALCIAVTTSQRKDRLAAVVKVKGGPNTLPILSRVTLLTIGQIRCPWLPMIIAVAPPALNGRS